MRLPGAAATTQMRGKAARCMLGYQGSAAVALQAVCLRLEAGGAAAAANGLHRILWGMAVPAAGPTCKLYLLSWCMR